MNDEKKDERGGSADLECKESMPSPDVFRIPVRYPWKRTYCGSEIYDTSISAAYSNSPASEQSAEDGSGHDQEEPQSPRVILANAEDDVRPSYEPVDSSYVWVSAEDGKDAPGVGRSPSEATGALKTDAPKTDSPKTDAPKTDEPKTDAPKTDESKSDTLKTDSLKPDTPKEPGVSYSSYSPTSPSDLEECAAECAKHVVGKTYYPVKIEKTEDDEPTPPVSPDPRSPPVSPRVGRTKSERVGGLRSLTHGLPKLERFSPPLSKPRIREDSVPLEGEEGPAKCQRCNSDAA